ncbi:SGNH/GDSL hydrolase family protein [Salipiger sp. IMCC34102]|uniref:SGNH/GDSL hydrolase family protein n=1 Tax=Salipiger sp. IMCC34102 TaxID=2510647 RepID=UPI00101C3E74|nr:SGNH/GDSL hydrolase family protein [Salipiger sp. IMCC34102]RYH03114.1 SGNH/GDSL hydrolase family protein [Salipiger sp. IMCC34102]
MTPYDLALAPLVAMQAIAVKARAEVMPEAAGPRLGEIGQGAALRILILGDSSAAGVGVRTQAEALAGQLTARLSRRHRVDWFLHAKSGATTASTLRRLRLAPKRPFDVSLVCLGINDAKNGVRGRAFQARYARVLDRLRDDYAVERVYLAGMPPAELVPALPNPLRDMLIARLTWFDGLIRQIAAARPGAVHLPFDVTRDPSLMASDRFHPGPKLYAEWAGLAAAAIQRDRAALH